MILLHNQGDVKLKHINISLKVNNHLEDIRIPTRIEVATLIRELDHIFNDSKPRLKYQLRVVNKGLLLDEGKVIEQYPLTTGDIVEIEEL